MHLSSLIGGIHSFLCWCFQKDLLDKIESFKILLNLDYICYMGEFIRSKSLFEVVEVKLKELYDWRDFYFCEEPSEKQAMLKGHIDEIDGMVEDVMAKDGSQKNMESNDDY